jgi:hypothetical protein
LDTALEIRRLGGGSPTYEPAVTRLEVDDYKGCACPVSVDQKTRTFRFISWGVSCFWESWSSDTKGRNTLAVGLEREAFGDFIFFAK